MRPFWYLNVSVWSGEQKLGLLGMCQNSVLAPYCKEWEPRYPPNTSKRLRFPWKPLIYPQTPPYIPQTLSDIPQTSPDISREYGMPTDDKRRQQTLPDILKQHLSVSGSVWRCLLAIVGMSCSLEMYGGCLWDVWGCLGDIWGVSGSIWVAFMEIIGTWMCLGGILVPIPCSMEPKHYFGTSLKDMPFFHLTILRH